MTDHAALVRRALHHPEWDEEGLAAVDDWEAEWRQTHAAWQQARERIELLMEAADRLDAERQQAQQEAEESFARADAADIRASQTEAKLQQAIDALRDAEARVAALEEQLRALRESYGRAVKLGEPQPDDPADYDWLRYGKFG